MLKLCFCVFLLGVAAASPTSKSVGNLKIVGGEDIDITEAPYTVSLQYLGRHMCGGTLVAHDLVVTAAHCVVGALTWNYKIRAGSSSITTGGQLFEIGEFIPHPEFSYSNMDSDIALIWLSEPVAFNDTIAAIDLFDEGKEIDDGEETIITGWGHMREGGGSPSTLQMVKVPTVNEGYCKDAYAPMYSVTSRMICAGHPDGGKDACQGDSGGPLVYDGKLAGVVSWGLGCARPKYPGVYAKVSSFRPWLDEKIIELRLKHFFRINF